MKNVKLVVWVVLAITLVSIIGCKRPCYRCYGYSDTFTAYKNGDTLVIGTFFSRTLYQDSFNYYTSMGYTIGIVNAGYFLIPSNDGNQCDPPNISGTPVTSDSCVEFTQ